MKHDDNEEGLQETVKTAKCTHFQERRVLQNVLTYRVSKQCAAFVLYVTSLILYVESCDLHKKIGRFMEIY